MHCAPLRCLSTLRTVLENSCPSAKSVCFRRVKATLTQLRRETTKVVRPVIHGGEKLTLTEHGQACAELVPLRKIDRHAACLDLMGIGPVEFLPRKRSISWTTTSSPNYGSPNRTPPWWSGFFIGLIFAGPCHRGNPGGRGSITQHGAAAGNQCQVGRLFADAWRHGDGVGCGIGADMGPIKTFPRSEAQATRILGQPD